MMFNIIDQLQSEPFKVVAQQVINLAKANNPEDLSQIVLQLFINFLGRKHTVTLEELETIDDDEDLDDLLFEIYQNEQDVEEDEVMSETVKSFLHEFFSEAFKCELVDWKLLGSWCSVLIRIVSHPEIPKNCVFQGNALHLMSLLLNPLCLQATKEETPAPDGSLKPIIKAIMKNIPDAFSFKTLCASVAVEFIEAMEGYHEILSCEDVCGDTNFLFLYKKLLLQENNILHTMALKSLKSLCYVQELQPQLTSFFFEKQDSEVDELESDTFMAILHELVGRKNLKIEITALMKAMTHLPGQHELVEDIQHELYLNIFSGSKKLMKETVDLMKCLDCDFWMEIIKLISSDVDESIDLPNFLTMLLSIDGVDYNPKTMLKTVLEKIHDPEISQNAADIFVELLKRDDEAKEMTLSILDIVLTKCLADEGTFTVMLRSVSVIDPEKMSDFFKQEPEKFSLMINCMAEAFQKFDQPKTLFNIADVLKKLSKISPSYVVKEIRQIYDKYYFVLMDVFEKHNDDERFSLLYKTPLTKLAILLENRSWNLIPVNSFKIIYQMNQELCKESNHPLFPLCVRFHTNFLKHIWARLVMNKTVLLSNYNLCCGIINFFGSLGDILQEQETLGKQCGLLICSVLDIAVMFQPKMSERYNHEVFNMVQLKLDKQNVKTMSSWVEKYVFGENSKSSDDEFNFLRSLVLLSWVVLCKNYTALPSQTSSESIIRHYRLKDSMKVHMDLLLEHLMTQKNIFEQTIAISTLNLANNNDMASFRLFHQAIEDFIQNHFDATKRISVTTIIASFILSKQIDALKNNYDEDRLGLLDYVSVFVKNISPEVRQKLASFISSKLVLTKTEKMRLEAFKSNLQQD